MSTRPLRLCTALTGGLLLAGIATANPFETTLDNGLKVIVKEDTRAPSAVHMVWYRAGAMDEPEGVSGIAHMLEHMMFKGTETVGPGEFNQRVAARGGRDNAFTSRDYTAYFQQIPPQYLGEMMALEADRMSHLKIDDAPRCRRPVHATGPDRCLAVAVRDCYLHRKDHALRRRNRIPFRA